jgi:hypothetical protein
MIVAEVEGATDATKEAAEPQTPSGVSTAGVHGLESRTHGLTYDNVTASSFSGKSLPRLPPPPLSRRPRRSPKRRRTTPSLTKSTSPSDKPPRTPSWASWRDDRSTEPASLLEASSRSRRRSSSPVPRSVGGQRRHSGSKRASADHVDF